MKLIFTWTWTIKLHVLEYWDSVGYPRATNRPVKCSGWCSGSHRESSGATSLKMIMVMPWPVVDTGQWLQILCTRLGSSKMQWQRTNPRTWWCSLRTFFFFLMVSTIARFDSTRLVSFGRPQRSGVCSQTSDTPAAKGEYLCRNVSITTGNVDPRHDECCSKSSCVWIQ